MSPVTVGEGLGWPVKDTLSLNADHSALGLLKWQRSIGLPLTDRVQRMVDDEQIRPASAGPAGR